MSKKSSIKFKAISFIKANGKDIVIGSVTTGIKEIEKYLKILDINLTEISLYNINRSKNKERIIQVPHEHLSKLKTKYKTSIILEMSSMGVVFFLKIKRGSRDYIRNYKARRKFRKDYKKHIQATNPEIPTNLINFKAYKNKVSAKFVIDNYTDNFDGNEFNNDHKALRRCEKEFIGSETEPFLSEILQYDHPFRSVQIAKF